MWCTCHSSAAAADFIAAVLDIKLSTITHILQGWKLRTLMAVRSFALVQPASRSGPGLSAAQQSTLRLLLLQDTKRCTSCKDFKPRDQFNKDKTRGDGLACTCRPCANRNTKNWHHKHRQQVGAPLPPTTAGRCVLTTVAAMLQASVIAQAKLPAKVQDVMPWSLCTTHSLPVQ